MGTNWILDFSCFLLLYFLHLIFVSPKPMAAIQEAPTWKTLTLEDAPSLLQSLLLALLPIDLRFPFIFFAPGSNPSSPSATVVRAHVHRAPPAGHLPVPESSGDGPAAASAALEATPPLLDIPVKAIDLPSLEVSAFEDFPPPEPVVAPPAPSTPPPSPEIPPTSQFPQQETTSPQQEDVQVLLPHSIVGVTEVDAPRTASPMEPYEAEPDEEPQQSPFTSHPPADDGSPDRLKTQEKSPVQDSAPPVTVLEPEETSDPADTQVTINTESLIGLVNMTICIPCG